MSVFTDAVKFSSASGNRKKSSEFMKRQQTIVYFQRFLFYILSHTAGFKIYFHPGHLEPNPLVNIFAALINYSYQSVKIFVVSIDAVWLFKVLLR